MGFGFGWVKGGQMVAVPLLHLPAQRAAHLVRVRVSG